MIVNRIQDIIIHVLKSYNNYSIFKLENTYDKFKPVHQHSCLLSRDSPSIKQKGPKSNSLSGMAQQNDTNRNYASLLRIGSHARGSTNEKVDPCLSVLFWAQILPP